MRKKLITGATVAAAFAVPATPAFAIHDPNVPGGCVRELRGGGWDPIDN